MSPPNTRPDSVESTPAIDGVWYLNSHFTPPVAGSMARIAL